MEAYLGPTLLAGLVSFISSLSSCTTVNSLVTDCSGRLFRRLRARGTDILEKGRVIMAFDIVGTFRQRLGANYTLHEKHINPA